MLFCYFAFLILYKNVSFFCLVKQSVTKDMLKSLIGLPFASFFILEMEGQVKRSALWNMLHINKLGPQIKKTSVQVQNILINNSSFDFGLL